MGEWSFGGRSLLGGTFPGGKEMSKFFAGGGGLQAFINYKLSCTRFCACKTIPGTRPCMWKIAHIKEQMCTLLIIKWYGSRNCTKLVLKPLAAKNSLSISVLCIATIHICNVYNTQSIDIVALPFLINWNEKQCSKSHILTIDHKMPVQLLFIHCWIPLSIWRP